MALPPHPRAEGTSCLLSMCFITENFLWSRTVVRSRYGWILKFTRSGPRKNVKYDAQQNRPLNTVFHANHTIFNTCLSSSVGQSTCLLSMCFITENFLLSRAVVRSRYEWILEFTRSGPQKNVKYDAQQNRPLNTAFHANHTIFNTCLSSSVGQSTCLLRICYDDRLWSKSD